MMSNFLSLRASRVDHATDVNPTSSTSADRKISDRTTKPCDRTIVAYLTNVYPKISHTFVRNEIAALERQGIAVIPITVRRTSETMIDPADLAEETRTQVLLGSNGWMLCKSLIKRALRNPRGVAEAGGLLITPKRGRVGLIRSIAYLVEACRLLDLTEEAGITHVHVHFGTNPSTVARLASRIGRLGYSVTMHGPDEFDAPRSLMLAEKIADARFVVAVSDFGRSQLMRWADPADWHKIAVVRCGVDTSWQATETRTAGLQSLTLVCVVRLSAQKGVPLLLDAVAALRKKGVNFRLRIIGGGELQTEVERMIADKDLSDCVDLVGWLSAEGVRCEIAAARALILPSFAEGLPVVLMEAMAQGRPVIATAVAGIPELVDSQCGWLIPAGSITALTTAMAAALEANPETLATMAAIGRTRVQRDHDLDLNAGKMARLLHTAITAPG